MCVHMYVYPCAFFFFLVSICSCLFSALYVGVRVCESACSLQRESSRIPLGVSLDIWLRIDSLNLRVKRPVEPLGAAALHIITSLLRLCLELRRNPIVWFIGLQICCVSFYTTSSPGPVSHLLQIRRQRVFGELSLSPGQDR